MPSYRQVSRASLQATTSGFILTADDLYQWCQQHITGIKFIWVDKEDIENHSVQQEARFLKASRIPGTRQNHSFVPGPNGLQISRISGQDIHYTCKQSESLPATDIRFSMVPGDYIACLYDGMWWIGSVRASSEENNDYEVVFMHPHGPAAGFRWPRNDDVCWVPAEHVLCKVDVPTTATGRLYNISEDDNSKIEIAFNRVEK